MIPKIALIGCGRFGQHHLRNLLELQKEHKIKLVCVVTTTEKTIQDIRTTTDVNEAKKADGIIIATPPHTHKGIICTFENKYLLVEKPLATSLIDVEKALQSTNQIMVGYIFRYTGILQELKARINQPKMIAATFIQPEKDINDTQAVLEFIHIFDWIDYLLETEGTVKKIITKTDSYVEAELAYNQTQVTIKVGWKGNEKIRTMTADNTTANFVTNTINNQQIESKEPLRRELESFIAYIKDKTIINNDNSLRIHKIIEQLT